MTQEYREAKGINYSELSKFNQSQDHALLETRPSTAMTFGNFFETALQDVWHHEKTIEKEYFSVDTNKECPKEVLEWIKDGEALEDKYVFTKSGERSKTYANRHQWLDMYIQNPGKFPVSKADIDLADTMIGNVLRMQIFNVTGNQFLKKALWQAPIYWETNGIQKKALLDAYVETDSNIYAIDIKTAANLKSFISFYRSKYWIQEQHYTEGIEATFGKICKWLFIVATKDAPNLAYSFSVENGNECKEKYQTLCNDYYEWDMLGRPEKGWKESEELTIYFR